MLRISDPKNVGLRAQEALGTDGYRIATAGYSAAPDGYELSTRNFLKALDTELGRKNTSYITSPTADKASIDAITTEIAGFKERRLFYTTAEDYVEYINPDNFPTSINKAQYVQAPKYVLPDADSYSRATAEASNTFIATGGRNATVSDFVYAINKGNKSIILDNTSLDVPAWDPAKNRVNNASRYLSEQIDAVRKGKNLPYPEVGKFTRDFITQNLEKMDSLLRIYKIDGKEESILIAAQKSAQFLKAKTSSDAPLVSRSPIVQSTKISMISKPNEVSAVVPDLTDQATLKELGFVNENGNWYAPNRDWYPRPLNENDIIIIYSKDNNGKVTDVGFCSKEEFSNLYTDPIKYNNSEIEFIDATTLPKDKMIEVTKCASDEVCILPIGTKLETNEGVVEVKLGEIVIVNEAKNSIYATSFKEILERYKDDPLNPASKELFNLLNEYIAN